MPRLKPENDPRPKEYQGKRITIKGIPYCWNKFKKVYSRLPTHTAEGKLRQREAQMRNWNALQFAQIRTVIFEQSQKSPNARVLGTRALALVNELQKEVEKTYSPGAS